MGAVAILSLALNLALTGVFILVVKRLLRSSAEITRTAVGAPRSLHAET